MKTNLQTSRITRIVFLLFVSMFLSFNSYAVKKSTVEVISPQASASSFSIDKNEKPNFIQRMSAKVLSKRLQKKVDKLNERGTDKPKLKKGMAIAALVLGILSFIPTPLAIVTAILAIIFGAVAMKKAKQEPDIYGGRGMANAGFILGIIAATIYLIVAFVYLLILIAFGL